MEIVSFGLLVLYLTTNHAFNNLIHCPVSDILGNYRFTISENRDFIRNLENFFHFYGKYK